MLQNAVLFLLSALFNILTFMLLLRFYLQLFRVSFRNPLGQMVVTLTDFLVKPARRWIPSIKKWDISTLLLAFLVQIILAMLISIIRFGLLPGGIFNPHILLMAILALVRNSVDLFFYAILIHAIMSWINPHHPLSNVLYEFTQPLLAPIRRVVPVMNGFDFSPLVALILLQMFNTVFITSMESHLNSVF